MKVDFIYAGNNLEFDLEFANRKTIKITVVTTDRIEVIAPIGVPKKVIIETVKNKAPWLLKKMYLLKNIPAKTIHYFISGEKFLYLGEEITLKVIVRDGVRKASISLIGDVLCVETPRNDKETIRTALELWYREKTRDKVEERIKFFQLYFKALPRQIKVKEQKRRWASCTYMNDILFNWRCAMAKPEVIDYIVVHEMCHMVHKNHSKDFWNLVQQIMPDYKIKTLWLKNNGMSMDF